MKEVQVTDEQVSADQGETLCGCLMITDFLLADSSNISTDNERN